MIPLHVSADIRLAEGYSEYEIDSHRDLELSFSGSGSCDVFIRIVRCPNLRIRTFAAADSRINFLFWNDSREKVTVDESHEVMRDAYLRVAYGECESGETDRNIWTALREEGARSLICSALFVAAEKKTRMNVVNFAPHTYGEMQNFAVVLKEGRLSIDAIGRIVNGARGSENHQTSRALCFEEGQRSQIIPELLIDENDVQASHAMSIGRVDEEQLYYLRSRGLSEKQCTMLISTGYLLPVADFIDNEELRQKLRAVLEEKVAAL